MGSKHLEPLFCGSTYVSIGNRTVRDEQAFNRKRQQRLLFLLTVFPCGTAGWKLNKCHNENSIYRFLGVTRGEKKQMNGTLLCRCTAGLSPKSYRTWGTCSKRDASSASLIVSTIDWICIWASERALATVLSEASAEFAGEPPKANCFHENSVCTGHFLRDRHVHIWCRRHCFTRNMHYQEVALWQIILCELHRKANYVHGNSVVYVWYR